MCMKNVKHVLSLYCILSINIFSAWAVIPNDDLIKVADQDSVGPFNLNSLIGQIVGVAYLSSDEAPDIFIQSSSLYADFSLYKYQGRNESGIPIFGEKEEISLPTNTVMDIFPSYIFQTEDKNVHMVWFHEFKIYHGLYNKTEKKFEEKKSVGYPRRPNSLTAYFGADNKLHVILGYGNVAGTGAPADEYSVYDGAGIYRGVISSTGLSEISYSGWIDGAGSAIREISPTMEEVYISYNSLSPIDVRNGYKGDIVAGSQFGGIYYYKNTGTESTPQYAKRAHIVDSDGNVIRHPAISPYPVAYPDESGTFCDIMASCEGGIYYYKFTGNFSADEKPVYEYPVHVLEKNANLSGGSLIIPCVVDWDGDGVLDIVSGTSQGFIYLFKNIGTNESFKFISGVPISADGEEIFIQGGYAESIQTPYESRWGYTCPNVIDWNEDGFWDILMGDARSKHSIYRGTSNGLEDEHPLYMNDLELRGRWRCRPGVAKLGDRMAYITLDDQNELHLYWRLDDYNLEDGGKLLLTDGSKISTERNNNGTGSGRAKFEIADWDGDGVKDLIIGSNALMSIPNPTSGIPYFTNRQASVIFMKNIGTDESPRYEYPVALTYDNAPLTFMWHACSAVVTELGGGTNILVGDERGRFYLLKREKLSHTNPIYKGVEVKIVSSNSIPIRIVSSGVEIYQDSEYTLKDINNSFKDNRFTQISLSESMDYIVIPEYDGMLYIATDAISLPEDMALSWEKLENSGLEYTDGTNSIPYQVYARSSKKDESIEIPFLGNLGTVLLSSKITEGCLENVDVSGKIIASYLVESGETVANPSIVSTLPGVYVVSYDITSSTGSKTVIMKTTDNGETWEKQTELIYGKSGSLFYYKGIIYLIGNAHASNAVVILSSLDGKDWTRNGSGLILNNALTSSTPIVRANGRIWKTLKSTNNNEMFFISVDENADISLNTNWKVSTRIPFNSSSFGGAYDWNVGNTILSSNGDILSLCGLRKDDSDSAVLVISASQDGTTAYIPESGQITIPGGAKKFTARYDASTGSYWALNNPVKEEDKGLGILVNSIKNYLTLSTASDLHSWKNLADIVYKENPQLYAFQSSDWIFEGDDILTVYSITWPDCSGTSSDIDKANHISFYRFEDARKLITNSLSTPNSGSKLDVYPNPSHDHVVIYSPENVSTGLSYKLIDIMGNIVLIGKITKEKEILNISGYPRGVYILHIENRESHKLIFY